MVKESSKAKAVDTDTPKQKRTQLTAAEKVAKLEAELQAAKDAAAAKDAKVVAALTEKREALVVRITKLTDQVEALDTEITAASSRLTPVEDVADAAEVDES